MTEWAIGREDRYILKPMSERSAEFCARICLYALKTTTRKLRDGVRPVPFRRLKAYRV